jgi:MFS family permease
VYQIEATSELLKGRRGLRSRARRWPRVSRNVVLLGLTSLFTDLSSEMVATILPLYLVFGLGLSPLQYGVVDGLYQGVAALVRVGGGLAGDRWRRHKEVASLGYGLSAACKLGYVAAGSALGSLSSIVVLDRIGKGIRTAPRDALISLSTVPTSLATAFGVHRALDTAGAMFGPLAAFSILLIAPGAFDAVFVVSFCLALFGVSILVLFVENRSGKAEASGGPVAVSIRDAFGLLGDRRFQILLAVGAALPLFTMSDGFLYLALQRQAGFDARFLPLLFTGSALVYMVLAVPTGRLADNLGRGPVFVGGYALLLPVYALLLFPVGAASIPLTLVLVGGYYAATDGVLMAFASSLLPESLRGSGLAFLMTAVSVARLLASVMLGALWTLAGLEVAVLAFTAGLVLAMFLGSLTLMRFREGIA